MNLAICGMYRGAIVILGLSSPHFIFVIVKLFNNFPFSLLSSLAPFRDEMRWDALCDMCATLAYDGIDTSVSVTHEVRDAHQKQTRVSDT